MIASEDSSTPTEDVLKKKWKGKEKRLMLSFDIGATYAAVAVAYVQPGSPPWVSKVSRWPGRRYNLTIQKVPSAVLYDQSGKLIACGAEAVCSKMELQADTKGWLCVRNFKLHLINLSSDVDEEKPVHLGGNLPDGVDLFTIYSDFMKYLLHHTRKYITETLGEDLWGGIGWNAEISLAHPNTPAATAQHKFLQQAAVNAGFISEQRADHHLHFVEEAEASARFCLASSKNGWVRDRFKKGTKIVVCDIGGSTADAAAYEILTATADSLSLRELRVPICLPTGGTRVDHEFSKLLRSRLSEISCLDPSTVDRLVLDGVSDFEEGAKREFGSLPEYEINLRSRDITESAVGVEKGYLTLKEYVLNLPQGRGPNAQGVHSHSRDIELCFLPLTKALVDPLNQLIALGSKIDHILLTGGLGESIYVQNNLTRRLPSCRVIFTDSQNSKAVAEGALLQLLGGESMLIERRERPFMTWATALFARAFRLR